ncbi:MAG: hypothetical protein LJE95_13360 [Acidobacteria bacterium]|jgi:hypothetical protein|nr:hypothetical protein [Acidobacteriota bacterium]
MTRSRSLGRVLLGLSCLALLLGLAACEDTTPTPEERQEVTKAVNVYLQHLADAYTNMDATRLKGVASPNEILSVQGVLQKLAASGDRVEATLLHSEVEKMDVFRVVNATVKLLEVWDVRRLDAYTGKEKGRNPGTVQHSVIQLRKIDGKWIVTGRRVLETQGGSQWKVHTPTSEAGEQAAPTPAAAAAPTPATGGE